MTAARECFCGKVHAPWWGRYVIAPSCKLRKQQERARYFDQLVAELSAGQEPA